MPTKKRRKKKVTANLNVLYDLGLSLKDKPLNEIYNLLKKLKADTEKFQTKINSNAGFVQLQARLINTINEINKLATEAKSGIKPTQAQKTKNATKLKFIKNHIDVLYKGLASIVNVYLLQEQLLSIKDTKQQAKLKTELTRAQNKQALLATLETITPPAEDPNASITEPDALDENRLKELDDIMSQSGLNDSALSQSARNENNNNNQTITNAENNTSQPATSLSDAELAERLQAEADLEAEINQGNLDYSALTQSNVNIDNNQKSPTKEQEALDKELAERLQAEEDLEAAMNRDEFDYSALSQSNVNIDNNQKSFTKEQEILDKELAERLQAVEDLEAEINQGNLDYSVFSHSNLSDSVADTPTETNIDNLQNQPTEANLTSEDAKTNKADTAIELTEQEKLAQRIDEIERQAQEVAAKQVKDLEKEKILDELSQRLNELADIQLKNAQNNNAEFITEEGQPIKPSDAKLEQLFKEFENLLGGLGTKATSSTISLTENEKSISETFENKLSSTNLKNLSDNLNKVKASYDHVIVLIGANSSEKFKKQKALEDQEFNNYQNIINKLTTTPADVLLKYSQQITTENNPVLSEHEANTETLAFFSKYLKYIQNEGETLFRDRQTKTTSMLNDVIKRTHTNQQATRKNIDILKSEMTAYKSSLDNKIFNNPNDKQNTLTKLNGIKQSIDELEESLAKDNFYLNPNTLTDINQKAARLNNQLEQIKTDVANVLANQADPYAELREINQEIKAIKSEYEDELQRLFQGPPAKEDLTSLQLRNTEKNMSDFLANPDSYDNPLNQSSIYLNNAKRRLATTRDEINQLKAKQAELDNLGKANTQKLITQLQTLENKIKTENITDPVILKQLEDLKIESEQLFDKIRKENPIQDIKDFYPLLQKIDQGFNEKLNELNILEKSVAASIANKAPKDEAKDSASDLSDSSVKSKTKKTPPPLSPSSESEANTPPSDNKDSTSSEAVTSDTTLSPIPPKEPSSTESSHVESSSEKLSSSDKSESSSKKSSDKSSSSWTTTESSSSSDSDADKPQPSVDKDRQALMALNRELVSTRRSYIAATEKLLQRNKDPNDPFVSNIDISIKKIIDFLNHSDNTTFKTYQFNNHNQIFSEATDAFDQAVLTQKKAEDAYKALESIQNTQFPIADKIINDAQDLQNNYPDLDVELKTGLTDLQTELQTWRDQWRSDVVKNAKNVNDIDINTIETEAETFIKSQQSRLQWLTDLINLRTEILDFRNDLSNFLERKLQYFPKNLQNGIIRERFNKNVADYTQLNTDLARVANGTSSKTYEVLRQDLTDLKQNFNQTKALIPDPLPAQYELLKADVIDLRHEIGSLQNLLNTKPNSDPKTQLNTEILTISTNNNLIDSEELEAVRAYYTENIDHLTEDDVKAQQIILDQAEIKIADLKKRLNIATADIGNLPINEPAAIEALKGRIIALKNTMTHELTTIRELNNPANIPIVSTLESFDTNLTNLQEIVERESGDTTNLFDLSAHQNTFNQIETQYNNAIAGIDRTPQEERDRAQLLTALNASIDKLNTQIGIFESYIRVGMTLAATDAKHVPNNPNNQAVLTSVRNLQTTITNIKTAATALDPTQPQFSTDLSAISTNLTAVANDLGRLKRRLDLRSQLLDNIATQRQWKDLLPEEKWRLKHKENFESYASAIEYLDKKSAIPHVAAENGQYEIDKLRNKAIRMYQQLAAYKAYLNGSALPLTRTDAEDLLKLTPSEKAAREAKVQGFLDKLAPVLTLDTKLGPHARPTGAVFSMSHRTALVEPQPNESLDAAIWRTIKTEFGRAGTLDLDLDKPPVGAAPNAKFARTNLDNLMKKHNIFVSGVGMRTPTESFMKTARVSCLTFKTSPKEPSSVVATIVKQKLGITDKSPPSYEGESHLIAIQKMVGDFHVTQIHQAGSPLDAKRTKTKETGVDLPDDRILASVITLLEEKRLSSPEPWRAITIPKEFADLNLASEYIEAALLYEAYLRKYGDHKITLDNRTKIHPPLGNRKIDAFRDRLILNPDNMFGIHGELAKTLDSAKHIIKEDRRVKRLEQHTDQLPPPPVKSKSPKF